MAIKKEVTKDKLKLTTALEEGPYYTPSSPERTSIAAPGTAGKKLVVEGRVQDIQGRPIEHAWVDFWQADGNGAYDNSGYNLRGHQYTDKKGRYHLETVRPKEYGPRTPHIHAKVRAGEHSPVLTTQLFFPGVAGNKEDSIFNSDTLMDVKSAGDTEAATFDFVVEK